MEWNYYIVFSWMRTELGLSGNELNAFALVYSYSQDGQGCYYGSLARTAELLGIGLRTVQDVLRRLIEKGYIDKDTTLINGVKCCSYRVSAGVWQKLPYYGKNCRGVWQNLPGGMAESANNNKSYNKEIINNTLSTAHARGKFIIPTVEEVAAYCASRHNGIDAQHFIDYYESNGWKVGRNPMQDWQATIRTWELREKQNPSPRPSPRRQETSVAAWAEEMYRKINDTYGK